MLYYNVVIIMLLYILMKVGKYKILALNYAS